jgi:hypothetical protein
VEATFPPVALMGSAPEYEAKYIQQQQKDIPVTELREHLCGFISLPSIFLTRLAEST